MGATAPMKVAGLNAVNNAAILAGVVLSQLTQPGCPVVYGTAGSPMDMRTGSFYLASPEFHLVMALGAGLARYYNLPCYSTSGVCDPKTPGTQSSVERLFSDILVSLSGPQYLHCAYGLLDGNSTFCLLQAVLDDAHFKMIKFFLRQPNINNTEIDDVLKQLREVVATNDKLYVRYIRPMLRSGQLSMPYPFEGEGEKDSAMALAYYTMNELLKKPVEHVDQKTTNKVFQEVPGILPRLNVYEERR